MSKHPTFCGHFPFSPAKNPGILTKNDDTLEKKRQCNQKILRDLGEKSQNSIAKLNIVDAQGYK